MTTTNPPTENPNDYNSGLDFNESFFKTITNAFSTAIAYTWTAIQTFTAGIKTNNIFCETADAIQATLYSDIGFGRDVIIGNALSNTLFNNVSALTANSGCNLLLNQVNGIATLCDAPGRTAALNIFTRSAEGFDFNTVKIGTSSGGNTTTIMGGVTRITRLKSTYIDTFVNSEDVVLYSENLTGYVKIADAPGRSGGVNIFSKGTTPENNTIKIGADSVDIFMLGELHSNQLDNVSANDPAKLYHSQHNATATLEIADHNTRVGGLNIFTRGEPFTNNTIKIGSAGNTTTEMEGTTNIVRLKTDFLDTSNSADDADLYSLNLTGYVKIADAPTRSGGVNIFSKGTTPSANTIKIGANSATTTELDGITKISNLTTTGNALLDGGVVRIGANGTNMELLQLDYVDNVGSNSYTITYPNAFTNAPVLTLSLERNDTTYSFYPQLIQSLPTGFTYRMMAITIGSNATSFIATDAHRLHFQTIEVS